MQKEYLQKVDPAAHAGVWPGFAGTNEQGLCPWTPQGGEAWELNKLKIYEENI